VRNLSPDAPSSRTSAAATNFFRLLYSFKMASKYRFRSDSVVRDQLGNAAAAAYREKKSSE
jgi:hypothetical protein